MIDLHNSLRLSNSLMLADLVEIGAYELKEDAQKLVDRLPESWRLTPFDAATLSPQHWVDIFENLRRQASRKVGSAVEDIPLGVVVQALAQVFANALPGRCKNTAEIEKYLSMFRDIVWICIINEEKNDQPEDNQHIIIYP